MEDGHEQVILYLDCYSGLSGDMLLGALLDLGLEIERLREPLATLNLGGWRLEAVHATSQGLHGTRALVTLDDQAAQPIRRLADIRGILRNSGLPAATKTRAEAVFTRLARAEAKVHGQSIDQVHFHEVGAVDAIIDIAGGVLGLELLGVEDVYASAVPLGSGLGKGRHGAFPIPAPATLELLAEVHAPTRAASVEAELLTPTGAALLAELAQFLQPPMRLERVGYGFGTRELPWPNAVRAWLGQRLEPSGSYEEEVVLLESTIDDMSPEQAGHAMERLLAAGALDVFFVAAQMKKNRPGLLFSVLAAPASARILADLVLRETTTLGVRTRSTSRVVAPRVVEEVQTRLGPARVKVKLLGGQRRVAPEYEDAARMAREHDISLSEAMQVIGEAAQRPG
jgi:uncharacterized protein (TIGR00299 family) protein